MQTYIKFLFIFFLICTFSEVGSLLGSEKIEGRVIDPIFEKPCNNIEIIATTNSNIKEEQNAVYVTTRCNSKGEFTLKGLIANKIYEVSANLINHVSSRTSIRTSFNNRTVLLKNPIYLIEKPINVGLYILDKNNNLISLPKNHENQIFLNFEDLKFNIPLFSSEDISRKLTFVHVTDHRMNKIEAIEQLIISESILEKGNSNQDFYEFYGIKLSRNNKSIDQIMGWQEFEAMYLQELIPYYVGDDEQGLIYSVFKVDFPEFASDKINFFGLYEGFYYRNMYYFGITNLENPFSGLFTVDFQNFSNYPSEIYLTPGTYEKPNYYCINLNKNIFYPSWLRFKIPNEIGKWEYRIIGNLDSCLIRFKNGDILNGNNQDIYDYLNQKHPFSFQSETDKTIFIELKFTTNTLENQYKITDHPIITGVYHGEVTIGQRTYLIKMYIKPQEGYYRESEQIMVNDIDGLIIWSLKTSESQMDINLIGKTATEYIKGGFGYRVNEQKESIEKYGNFILNGYKKDDPFNLFNLHNFNLIIKSFILEGTISDSSSMVGHVYCNALYLK